MFFTFPEDARWNEAESAVEFGVEIGEYAGVVRVPRRIFQHLLAERPTPEKCVEGYHLHRTQRCARSRTHPKPIFAEGGISPQSWRWALGNRSAKAMMESCFARVIKRWVWRQAPQHHANRSYRGHSYP